MTFRTHRSARAHPGRRPAAVGVLALVLAWAATTGCGLRLLGGPSEPTGRRERPKLSVHETRVREAREQMALDPTEPYWPYRLGQTYVEADSLAQAEAALESSLRRDPSYAPALSLLSKLHFDGRRHAEAVALLESARARPGAFPNGVPPEILAGLALHYEALGRHDLASALVGDASRSEGARSATVYVLLRGGNAAAAGDLASAAVDEEPKSAANHNNHGIALLRAGDPRAARTAFLRAIELDPGLPGPYYNLAILERHYLFDDAAASRWLRTYRERASQDPDGLFGAVEKGEPMPVVGEGR